MQPSSLSKAKGGQAESSASTNLSTRGTCALLRCLLQSASLPKLLHFKCQAELARLRGGLHLPSCQTEDSVSLGGGGGEEDRVVQLVFTRAGRLGWGAGGTRHKLKKDKGHYTGRLTYFTLRSGNRPCTWQGSCRPSCMQYSWDTQSILNPREADPVLGPGQVLTERAEALS